jgi:hypothetical protein
MVINLPSSFFDDTAIQNEHDSVKQILFKLAIICILGNFCLTAYNPAINLLAIAGIVFIFVKTLVIKDNFSLIIQLFFANHYVFGNDKGGLFNIAALIAMLIYNLSGRQMSGSRSSFGRSFNGLLLLLFACQLLSLTANTHAGLMGKVGGMLSFSGIILLVYQLSKVPVRKADIIRFIYILFVFNLFELGVSLNQKYGFIAVNSPLIPRESNVEYEFDIFRCMGTFIDFEAYAEYSLSLIALLLPGIISGSFRKVNLKFYYMTIGIVIIAFLAIVLTVTRSSLFILPFVILFILFSQYKKVKLKAVMPFVIIIAIGVMANIKLKIFDISSFIERSQEMKIKSISDVTSGSEINRGEIFAFAFEKIRRSKGLIGEGYFTNPADYNTAHFDTPKPVIGDYHNLYLSVIVFWGGVGAAAFLAIFLFTIYKGTQARKHKNITAFDSDILLGFTTLFIFFLLNQYKIIFLRESNYTVVVLIFLVIYRGLIKKVTSSDIKLVIN